MKLSLIVCVNDMKNENNVQPALQYELTHFVI